MPLFRRLAAALALLSFAAVAFRFVGPRFLSDLFPRVILASLWGGTARRNNGIAPVTTRAPSDDAWFSARWMASPGWNLFFFGLTCALIVWVVRQAHCPAAIDRTRDEG